MHPTTFRIGHVRLPPSVTPSKGNKRSNYSNHGLKITRSRNTSVREQCRIISEQCFVVFLFRSYRFSSVRIASSLAHTWLRASFLRLAARGTCAEGVGRDTYITGASILGYAMGGSHLGLTPELKVFNSFVTIQLIANSSRTTSGRNRNGCLVLKRPTAHQSLGVI